MAPSGGVSPLPVPRGEDSGGPRSPGSVASSDDGALEVQCGTAEFGGHLMKAGLIAFQVLLCMKLEVGPPFSTGDTAATAAASAQFLRLGQGT